MKKILYKFPNNTWAHFCYLPDGYSNHSTDSLNGRITKWAKEEFGLELNSVEDIVTLKNHIRDKYKEVYPDLYYDISKNYDMQGWTRVWVLQHLREEANEQVATDNSSGL